MLRVCFPTFLVSLSLLVMVPGSWGAAGGFLPNYDMAKNPGANLDAPQLRAFGGEAGDGLGSVIRSGDINGDHRDDLVVATKTGKIHVWFGSAIMPTAMDAAARNGAAPVTTISGFAALRSLSVGDVNGDGKADIIVGMTPIEAGHSEMAIIFGKSQFDESIRLDTPQWYLPTADVFLDVTYGEDGLALDGALTLGDLNGDGFMEIVVGTPYSDHRRTAAGAAYVVWGRASFPFHFDLRDTNVLYGAETGGALTEGGALHAADLNGDGKDDLIVGAPKSAGRFGQPNAGQVYIVFGDTQSEWRSASDTRAADVIIYGEGQDTLTRGGQIASGDVNGDGTRDLLLGSPAPMENAGQDGGNIWVILGRTTFPAKFGKQSIQGSGTPDMVINGGVSSYGLTVDSMIVASDVNGDGADDILVSTPAAPGMGGASAQNAGRVYIVLGSKSPANLRSLVHLSSAALATKPDVTIFGASQGDYLTRGGALITGDLDGDGLNDIILGSDLTAGSGISGGRMGGGRAYAVLGRSAFQAQIDLRNESDPSRGANVRLWGASASDALTKDGALVMADLNGDDAPELILGAPNADGPGDARADAGEIYALPGVSRAELELLDPKGSVIVPNMNQFPMVDLGKVSLGKPVTFRFTVKNTGRLKLSGLDATLVGGDHQSFEIPTSSLPHQLNAKSIAPLDIIFTPGSLGVKEVKLELWSADADERQTLVRLNLEVIRPLPPVVKTLSASAAITSAMVTGQVNPKGVARLVFFDYGLTKEYGETFQVGPVPAASTEAQLIAATLPTLLPHTRYHYRIRAASNEGAAAGGNATFTTGNREPVAADDAFEVVGGSTVTLAVGANDADADQDGLSIESFTPPKAGSLTVGKLTKAGSSMTFAAPADFNDKAPGGVTFTYTIKDGFGGSSEATVTVMPGTAVVEAAELTFSGEGGEQTVSVAASGLWSVSAPVPWIDADLAEGDGTGAGAVSIAVEPNLSKAARRALVTVAGAKILVIQNGAIKPVIALPAIDIPSGLVSSFYELPIITENGPVTYAVKGLPSGLTINQATGVINGRPNQAGSFEVTVKARNAADSADETLNFVINISPLHEDLPGTYLGLIAQTDSAPLRLGARLEVTITTSGGVTGRVLTGLVTRSFTGRLDAAVSDADHPVLTVPLPTEADSNAELQLVFGAATQTFSGVMADSRIGQVIGWRKSWSFEKPASAFTGLHTFRLTTDYTAADLPAGYGYGSFTVSENSGAVTVSGKLADNSTFITTGFIGQQGQLLIHQPLYHKKGLFGTALGQGPPRSAFAGVLAVTKGHTLSENVVSSVGGFEPVWAKAPTPSNEKDTVYAAGISGYPLYAEGGAYTPPAPGTVIMGLANQHGNAQISFLLGSLDSDRAHELSVRNPTTNGKTQVATPSPPVQDLLRLSTLNATTGTFSGTFTLAGATSATTRKVTYQGQIVKIGSETKGYGFFLLPQLPVSIGDTLANVPKWSGQVVLKGSAPP